MNGLNINPNDKQSQSQNMRILAHLKTGGKITALSALEKFNCMRLSARIKDLKEMGYPINSEFIRVPSGKRVKAYFMEVRYGR